MAIAEAVKPTFGMTTAEWQAGAEQRLQDAIDYGQKIQSGEIYLGEDEDRATFDTNLANIQYKYDLLQQAKQSERSFAEAGEPIPQETQSAINQARAISLSPASPFISLTKEGQITAHSIKTAEKLGISLSEFEKIGFSPGDIQKIKDFEAQLKETSPESYAAYKTGGIEGYNKAVSAQQFVLSHKPIMAKPLLEERATQKITQEQYNEALTLISKWQRGESKYDLTGALAANNIQLLKGEDKKQAQKVVNAIDLLFDPEKVAKAKTIWRSPGDLPILPSAPAKGTSAIPGILAIGGPIALAEPTPIGEIALAAILAGYGLYEVGKQGAFTQIKNAVANFRKTIGRNPQTDEIIIADKTGNVATLAEIIPFSNLPSLKTGEKFVPPYIEPKTIIGGGVKPVPFSIKAVPQPTVTLPQLPGTTLLEPGAIKTGSINWKEPIVFLPGTQFPIPERLINDKTTLAERNGVLIASANQVSQQVKELPITRQQSETLNEAIRQGNQVRLAKQFRDINRQIQTYQQEQEEIERKRRMVSSEEYQARHISKRPAQEMTSEETLSLKAKYAEARKWAMQARENAYAIERLETFLKTYRHFAKQREQYAQASKAYEVSRDEYAKSLDIKPISGKITKEIASAYVDSILASQPTRKHITHANAIAKQAEMVATETYAKAVAEGKTKRQAMIQAREATQSAVQQAIKTQTQVQEQTQTREATQTSSVTKEATGEKTTKRTTRKRRPGGGPKITVKKVTGAPLTKEAGSVSWRQGRYWITIHPPYKKGKESVTYDTKPPIDAAKLLRTPQETLFARKSVPKEIDLGMGVVRSEIRNGKRIKFFSQHIKLT